MIATLLSTLVLAPAMVGLTPPSQTPKIDLSVTPGDQATVMGEVTFTVRVTSKDPVNNVEFYVGGDLRESDTSTPYEFKIDTISESDGPLKLTFAAYSTEGDNVRKSITVNVDNGMAKGADFHVQAGNEFLSVSKFDDAIRSGRIALKIKSDHNGARLLMARAYRAKGVMDSAQKFAEDALAADPKLYEAADLLSAINLSRAFSTFNRGGNKEETLGTIRSAMISAVKSRRLVLDAALEALGPVTDANRLQVADAAIKAGRYSVAITALADTFRRNSTNVAVGNRLAYAQLRAGRVDDAMLTMNEIQRVNAQDGYSYALQAIIQFLKGSDELSDAAMKEAILNDPEGIGIQTAQAYIALRRHRTDVLRNLITRLAKDQGQRTEVNYYLAVMYNMTGQYVEGQKAFETAVLAEPTNYAMYVQRGNEAMQIVVAGRVDPSESAYQAKVARAFYDVALEAKPESAEALTGVAIISVYNKNINEAVSFAQAAGRAGPGYAAAFYAQAMIFSRMEAELKARSERIRNEAKGPLTSEQQAEINRLNNQANDFGRQANAAMRRAEQLDTANLSGRGIPNPDVAFTYFARHGRLPLLVNP